jgi:purine-binding chemotaxis protein CheW
MTEVQTNAAVRELIAFRIGEQEFCVDIMSVREIRGWTPATPAAALARLHEGRHQPARRRAADRRSGRPLGLTTSDPTARHVIMVAHIGGRTVGLLVDAVSDIIQLTDGHGAADARRGQR